MPTNKPSIDTERPSTPLFIDLFAAQAMLAALLGVVLGVIGTLPRNPDNSMQAIYIVPTFLILALVSSILLWKQLIPHRAVRIVCWFLIVIAMLVVPLMTIDLMRGNGS